MRAAGRLAAGILALLGLIEAGGVVHAATPATPWERAIEVPGTFSLNVGGNAKVSSMSCPSRGFCVAVGEFANFKGFRNSSQGFVVSRKNGRWGRAQEVPGLAKLVAGFSQLDSVSCGSPGDCVAGGYYVGPRSSQQAFVVTERNGTWGSAMPVAQSLNVGDFGEVYSVSCPSAGNCAATGYYGSVAQSSNTEPFVISERNGAWGTAIEVPGIADLSAGEFSRANWISCSSAGNCALGGFYADRKASPAFVASEHDGRWRPAIEVPGLAKVSAGLATVESVSCSAPGNCAAAGYYQTSKFHIGVDSTKWQAFAVAERNGTWGKIVPLLRIPPVTDDLSVPGVKVASMSCPSTGNCMASGVFWTAHGLQAFVVGENKGHWGTIRTVLGSGALNRGGFAEAMSVSCPSAGNCLVGGYFSGVDGHRQAFIAGQRNGRWSKAVEVPGSKRLNVGGVGEVTSVSCAAIGQCSVGGGFKSHHRFQAFVASQRG